MLDIIISADTSGKFDIVAVERTTVLMRELQIYTQNLELVIGVFEGKRELAVYARDVAISSEKLKKMLQKYSQQSCLVLWPKAGAAEEFSGADNAKFLPKMIQTLDVLQDENGTYFPLTNQMVQFNAS